jgi:exosortase
MNRSEKSEITGSIPLDWKVIAVVAVLLGVLFLLFRPTLLWMNERFFEEHSYYTHGWLIPPAIAFLLYQRRKIIIRTRPRPSWTGLGILIPGLLLHIFAQFFGINFISGLALPVVVFGLILLQWGWGRGRYILGPLLLTIFMIPLPGIWVISIAFHLKIYSAAIGVALGRIIGINIIHNGIEIVLPAAPPGETLTIGDPCSGLRSLISFSALGGFFSLLFPLSIPRRVIIFLAAVILAPISNILRVVSLIILRQTVGPGILSGPWHIVLGALIFFFCFLLLLQVIRWVLR